MLTYIENLENKLNNTTDEKEKKSIILLLEKEKNSCKKILNEYSSREMRSWIKCKEVCTHEKEIIKIINKIIYK